MSNNATSVKMPKGIAYIIGNEAAERYSFYGMKAILFIFMTTYLRDASGSLATMTDTTANFWIHMFVFTTYFLPLVGAFLSDIVWGKYRTIIRLSIIYCIGHGVLAVFENEIGLFIGLGLIALGAGGIKPCVSAHVGDQFDKSKSHLFERVFLYFYLAINAGAVVAYMSAEWLLHEYGAPVAFGLPGLLMFIATIVFWMGRKHFIAIKPAGWQTYRTEIFSSKGLKTLGKLVPMYLFVAMFWSLFDQTGSAWVAQADSDLMNKTINLGFTQFDFLPSQVGFFNPLLIVIFIPLFSIVVYPFLGRFMQLSYMNKISIGLFLAGLSFALIAWVQGRMDAGVEMSIMWQILAYFILTAAEIFVSVTALEFSYTQAPNVSKSFVMSFYLLSVAIGNLFTALVNLFIENPDGTLKLAGASYYWFFTGMMFVTALIFFFYRKTYREQVFVQSAADIERV